MDEGVVEAARAVRPYLEEFVGSKTAGEVDDQLSDLLARATDGDDVEYPLREILTAHESTDVFLERVLGDAPDYRPPRVIAEITRGYQPLPGGPGPVAAEKFVCPFGDYVWYRPEVGAALRPCPTHPHAQLRAAT